MGFVILESIANSILRRQLAFKGGNALRYIFFNPRSTLDLDFSATEAFPDDREEIRSRVDDAVRRGAASFGVKAKCQRVNRNPRGEDKTTPTYEIRIGYQFRGDRYFPDLELPDRVVSSVLHLEISLNDVVCESRDVRLHPVLDLTIRACTLEDILAEKLRALLQQRIRNRNRRQDVYDLARMRRTHGSRLDIVKLADFFTRKCKARGIDARRGAFDDDIRRRASNEYETLFDAGDPDFIPFDAAWGDVLALVGGLSIPD
ncbi:MAG: hypothetical protein FLDDKLPJ_01800 [Phycisphaerae bacterium]|nr:hypothetical protein [Phycisphaerae bacterium]